MKAEDIPRFDYASAIANQRDIQLGDLSVQAIDLCGAAIVENALEERQVESIVAEMHPYIETTPHGLHGLAHARRVGALVARSSASHASIAHPAVLSVCDAVLGKQQLSGSTVRITQSRIGEGRYPWRLSLTQVIDVGPGQEQQGMHCGNGLWVHDFGGAGFHPQLETMWALSDFTQENGATHVILGSHRWADGDRGRCKSRHSHLARCT